MHTASAVRIPCHAVLYLHLKQAKKAHVQMLNCSIEARMMLEHRGLIMLQTQKPTLHKRHAANASKPFQCLLPDQSGGQRCWNVLYHVQHPQGTWTLTHLDTWLWSRHGTRIKMKPQ